MSDNADIPLEGHFCACGLKESTTAWDAGTVGCPECNASWPDALVRRYPYDSGLEVRSYKPAPPAVLFTFTMASTFAPNTQAWIVAKEPCILSESPCMVCDGTGKVGGTVKVACPGQKGGAPLLCHHGKTRKVEDRWVALPAKIHTITASWVRPTDGAHSVTLFVRWSGGVDRNTDRVVEKYRHGDSDDRDEPYLCVTEGKARRIALERNAQEDE